MRVWVLGAGAIGSLFGARWSEAGHQVVLVGRALHVAAVRRDGLQVEGTRPGVVRLDATERLPEGDPPDAVLLGMKTFDLDRSVADLGARLPGPVPVLAPQNGLGIAEVTAAGLARAGWPDPAPWVVRAIHSVPATLVGPGVVRQAGEGSVAVPVADRPAAARWSTLVADLGYPWRAVPSIAREEWRKVVVNAAINPVTADHRILNGQLRDDPWRGQAIALLDEALAVAAAGGEPLDRDEALADLWRVVHATAENRSSMLQDLDRDRPTEIDAISGELLRLGHAHGLALPATQRAVDRIRFRVASAAHTP